jgi:hypothetical protein
MKKLLILLLAVFVACGGYIDTSYEQEVLEVTRKIFSDVSSLSDEELIEKISESCNFYYRDYEQILDYGDWGGLILEFSYQRNRDIGLDPYLAEELLEAEFNYCGFNSNYASLDTDILLCSFEYEYQVYYLGNINYDDTSIPCESLPGGP